MKNQTRNLVIFSKGITDFGDWSATVVAPILLYSITGSASATALLIACRLAPYFIANFILKYTGTLNISSVKIIRYASLARGIIIPLFLFSSEPYHFYLITLAVYGLGAILSPNYFSLLKGISDNDTDLSRSNNYMLGLQNVTMVLGPIIGAFLQVHIGFGFVFLLNALVNLVAFTTTFHLHIPACIQKDRTESFKLRSIIPSHPLLTKLILVDAVSGIAFGSLNAIIPMVNQMRFENSPFVYSIFLAFLTGGMFIGNLIFHFVFSNRKMTSLYIKVTFVALVWYACFCLTESLLLGVVLLMLTGIGNSLQDVALITAIQKDTLSSNSAAFVMSLRDSLGALSVLLSVFLLSFFSTDGSITAIGIALWLISSICCLAVWFTKGKAFV